ncbi:MAG: cyclic nucleotide-binding domain-containing protein [Bacteroidetes bacterium]|nr:cyclic nucleotide-binding domain-containing protein [Bacteroidota bacterium]
MDFSDAELDAFIAKMELIKLEKKKFILEEGEICHHQYFLLEGLVHTFYLDQDGNERTSSFALENWWFTSLESYIKQSPSFYSIQTIEPCVFLKIAKTDLDALFDTIPNLEKFFRLMAQNMVIALQRRTDIYQKMISKERYEYFRRNFPEFFQRVPQYLIASYLEITPEYLSSLRNSK